MKCTDNYRSEKYRLRKKRRKRIIILMVLFLFALCGIAGYLIYEDYTKVEHLAAEYEAANYTVSLYEGDLYAKDLCVVSENVAFEGAPDGSAFTAAGLFDVADASVDYAFNVHEKLYPASVTKIMTALLAIENGNLSDEVTVQVDASDFAVDETVCHLKRGDTLTLEDLLYGLLLSSGNDAAVAIAEHIAGSVEAFVEMMNQRAAELMATNTHFANPHGLHDDNHYTTAYDLYLIFNECIKHEEFVNIIGPDKYTADIAGADGAVRTEEWKSSVFYKHGKATLPTTAEIVGGKTGTTKLAGSCLILLEKTSDGNPYISVVMGAEQKDILYQNMTVLINGIGVS